MKTSLGKLEKVELRDVWESESSDFTPWLAKDENIKVLGKEIGLDLDVEEVEKNVVKFRADILCKDVWNAGFSENRNILFTLFVNAIWYVMFLL